VPWLARGYGVSQLVSPFSGQSQYGHGGVAWPAVVRMMARCRGLLVAMEFHDREWGDGRRAVACELKESRGKRVED